MRVQRGFAKNRVVGSITACIAGDHRYSSRVEVVVEGREVVVVFSENGASGGMDGDGGSLPFAEKRRVVVASDPRAVLRGVRAAFDGIIRTYGTPTKRFGWSTGDRGLSVEKCRAALVTAGLL